MRSRRRCCLCFWLNGIDDNQKGQIAHLDRNKENCEEENLVFLCLPHHDEYDSRTRQSKGLKPKEVRHWRDELYREMAYRFKGDMENQQRFAYLEQVMPDLLNSMRRELEKHPIWRSAVIRDVLTKVDVALKLFVYSRKEIPELREKIGVLVNQGLVTRSEQFYTLSETLVDYLRIRS